MTKAAQWTSPRELSNRLALTLCLGAIAIGIIVLIGYALGSASIAALGTNGKPVAAVSALVFIVLGAGLLALRWPLLTGMLTPRRAALAVIVIAAASLLSAALSRNLEEWQVWAAHGGVNFHAFPVTALLILALGSTLALVTTRWDLAGHLIASAVLLICVVFLFGYVLRVPSFLDPLGRLAPVAVTTSALALLSAAAVLVRPRGWVIPLLSRTSAGAMSRLLLPAIFVVPFFSIALNQWLTEDLEHTPQVGLTAVVAVNVFFGAALLLGAGAALHRRESDRLRLAAIVNSSAEAITGISSTGIIESWNCGAEQIYGYTEAEAIGRSIRMLAPPEREEEIVLLLERARRGERGESIETVRVAKDGRRVDVLLSVSPVLDDEGNLSGASAIAHDITDRRKAEEAVVKSEARYRTLVENLPQKVFLKDRHSVYVSVNEAYARDRGIEPKAVAGKTDFDFFPEQLAAQYRTDDARIMEAGVTETLEEEYVERGQRRFMHAVKTPIKDAQGNVTGILGILWDITEKKLAEERLTKAMAELERFNRDLAKSGAALREAQRTAAVGHWEWSPVTGAATWSDETWRILGISNGSVGASFDLFTSAIVAKDRRMFEEVIAGALRPGGESDISVDMGITTPAGQALALSTRILLDRDAGGNVLQLHGTIQDITRRVASEEALRQQTAALERSNADLERFNRLAVGRELRMIDLKRQINDLYARLGQPAPYVLPQEHAVAKETS